METEKPKAPFEEELGGLFYDVFRAAGNPINALNQEKILKLMPRFSAALGREAHKASLKLVKRLQEATKEGFDVHDKMVEDLREGTKDIFGEFSKLLMNFDERLTSMEKKLDELDRKDQEAGERVSNDFDKL